MIIKLNNECYTLNDACRKQLIFSIRTKCEEEYGKIEGPLYFVIKSAAREILRFLEKDAQRKGRDGTIFREAKKSDPMVHFIALVSTAIAVMLDRSELIVTTNDAQEIVSLETGSDTDAVGRTMAPHGGHQQRKNNSAQIS